MSRLLKKIQETQQAICTCEPRSGVRPFFCSDSRQRNSKRDLNLNYIIYPVCLLLGVALAVLVSNKREDIILKEPKKQNLTKNKILQKTETVSANITIKPLSVSENLWIKKEIKPNVPLEPILVGEEPLIKREKRSLDQIKEKTIEGRDKLIEEIEGKENLNSFDISLYSKQFYWPHMMEDNSFSDTMKTSFSKMMALRLKIRSNYENLILQSYQKNYSLPLLVSSVPFQKFLFKLRTLISSFNTELDKRVYKNEDSLLQMAELTPMERDFLSRVYQTLSDFNVDGVRVDGSNSRVFVNGLAYYMNTLISKNPRIKLVGLTTQELIFNDENNQEYRKKIYFAE